MVETGGMAASRAARLTANRHGGLSGGGRGFSSGRSGAAIPRRSLAGTFDAPLADWDTFQREFSRYYIEEVMSREAAKLPPVLGLRHAVPL
jgi:hypothetical protein